MTMPEEWSVMDLTKRTLLKIKNGRDERWVLWGK